MLYCFLRCKHTSGQAGNNLEASIKNLMLMPTRVLVLQICYLEPVNYCTIEVKLLDLYATRLPWPRVEKQTAFTLNRGS